MCIIYRYEGDFPKGDKGFDMIKKCAASYAAETGAGFDETAEIVRDEGGKPRFSDMSVHFSLTHSGGVWMCAFCSSQCGLDMQIMEPRNYQSVARRFFDDYENRYVMLNGFEGFYDIWARKEAFCKWTGKGFFSEMPSMACYDGRLADCGVFQGRDYCFTEISEENARCILCSDKKNVVKVVTVKEFLW